jgi:hypothetical protein
MSILKNEELINARPLGVLKHSSTAKRFNSLKQLVTR